MISENDKILKNILENEEIEYCPYCEAPRAQALILGARENYRVIETYFQCGTVCHVEQIVNNVWVDWDERCGPLEDLDVMVDLRRYH